MQRFQEVINIILSTMLRYCPCYRQANAIGIIEMDWLATQSIQIRHFAGMQWIVHLYVIPADQKKKSSYNWHQSTVAEQCRVSESRQM